MARTSSAAVQAILGSNYDGSTSLTPFIDTASSIVDNVSTCATARDDALTVAELELIERWLTAHCYVQMDQTYASKSTEGAGAGFHGQTGMYLENSKYGQMALSVDHSGCLSGLQKGGAARGFWLGKAPSGQTAYRDRD